MSLAVLLHITVVCGFSLRLLLRDDLLPTARLAWFVVIASLPYAGAVLYFLFGEVDLGRHADRRHDAIFRKIRASAAPALGRSVNLEQIDPIYRPVFAYAASINGFYPLADNSAELMADAQETRQRLVADIDAATDHINVLYYIWLDDNTGTALAEALIRAAKRGVTCRAMADGLGSRAMIKSPLWARMEKAGVQLAVALPVSSPVRTIITSRLDLRNHRKITVIDGAITYCGSRNSADPEFRIKAKFAPWVDIMMRFTGPVVLQNQLLFASDWMQATGQDLDVIALPDPVATGPVVAQVIGVGPTERKGASPQLFSTAIACARSHITISTPYFVPDATVLESLCAAAHRGVAVTLVFPQRNDSWIVAAASRSSYRKLLEAGCKIHEFQGGLLHAKTMTIDHSITIIGSSNLDLRSFDLNYENNILLQDVQATKAVFERQQDYLASAVPLSLQDVKAWPAYRRMWNHFMATMGPVL